MSAQRDVIDYLQDILDAAESATAFVGDLSVEAFAVDKKTVFVVVRALEIMGEATKRLPEPLRQRYPDVPWRAMAGMRDKLAHDYITVDASARLRNGAL